MSFWCYHAWNLAAASRNMAQAAAHALGECLPFNHNHPLWRFQQAQKSCELAARRVRLALLHAEVEEEQSRSGEDRDEPQEVRSHAEDKIEYLKGVHEVYFEVRRLLLTKRTAIETACDDDELPATARDDLEKMSELFNMMEVHMYRLLGVPDGWFSIQVERWKNRASEHPTKAACEVGLGGAFCAGVIGLLNHKGLFIFYKLGLVSAPLSLPTSLVVGFLFGAGLVLFGLVCRGEGEIVNVGREEATNQIEAMRSMVNKIETIPDEEFAAQLGRIMEEYKNVQERLPHHEDQLCSVCLEEGHEVIAPVKAPRCKGKHYMCMEHWEGYINTSHGADRRCAVCRV